MLLPQVHLYYVSPQQLACHTGNTEPWKAKLIRAYAQLYKILENWVMCTIFPSNIRVLVSVKNYSLNKGNLKVALFNSEVGPREKMVYQKKIKSI